MRDRRRWKSDFDNAASKAKTNVTDIEELVQKCVEQNSMITKAIKMVVDAQMIAQLVESQEQLDKKQIGVFGMKKAKEIVKIGDAVEDVSEEPVIKIDKGCL